MCRGQAHHSSMCDRMSHWAFYLQDRHQCHISLHSYPAYCPPMHIQWQSQTMGQIEQAFQLPTPERLSDIFLEKDHITNCSNMTIVQFAAFGAQDRGTLWQQVQWSQVCLQLFARLVWLHEVAATRCQSWAWLCQSCNLPKKRFSRNKVLIVLVTLCILSKLQQAAKHCHLCNACGQWSGQCIFGRMLAPQPDLSKRFAYASGSALATVVWQRNNPADHTMLRNTSTQSARNCFPSSKYGHSMPKVCTMEAFRGTAFEILGGLVSCNIFYLGTEDGACGVQSCKYSYSVFQTLGSPLDHNPSRSQKTMKHTAPLEQRACI